MNSVSVEKTSASDRVANTKFAVPCFTHIRNLSIVAESPYHELSGIFRNAGFQRKKDSRGVISEAEIGKSHSAAGRSFGVKILSGRRCVIDMRYPGTHIQTKMHRIFTASTTKYQVHQLTWRFCVHSEACNEELYGDMCLDRNWLSEFYKQYDGAMRVQIINEKPLYSVEVTWTEPEFAEFGITELPIVLRNFDYHELFNF